MGKFELYWPWWITGQSFASNEDETGPDYEIVCSVIKARDEEHAMEIVRQAHDDKDADIKFSFVNYRENDWSPYCDRFQKDDWPPSDEFIKNHT